MEVAAVLKEEEKCDDGRDREGEERWSFFVCLGKEEEMRKGFVRQAAAVGGTATVNAPVTQVAFIDHGNSPPHPLKRNGKRERTRS
jgi:RAB protein geranylgeranyltransferase component A